MTYTYHIVDTRTGVKQFQVFPVSGSCNRLLNNAGSGGSHVFQLGGPTELTPAQWKALTRPWARTLVVSWRGLAKYAAPISKRSYDRGSQQLTVRQSDIRVLLGKRFPFGGAQYRPGSQTDSVPGMLLLENMQLYSVAAQVVLAGMNGPFDIYSLPIVLPDTVAGGYSQAYYNENFVTVEAALQEIQSRDGGPDIDFAPRWSTAGTLEWVMRVGSQSFPRLSGTAVEWNMTVPEPGVFDLNLDEDAANQVTGVFAVGNGSGQDMMVEGFGAASLGDTSLPAMDTTRQFKQITDSVTLQAHAHGEVDVMRAATKQWSLSMFADGHPGLNDFELGSPLSLYFRDDAWADDGWTRLRCIGYTLGMSDVVSVDVQPIGA